MKSIPVFLLSAFVFLLMPGSALALDTGFEIQTVVSGLNLPTKAVYAPDGRLFIAEKSGIVRIYEDGALLPTPFITLANVNDYGDRGLTGIALDPNFTTNGYVYLLYTLENTPGSNLEGPKTSRLIRVTEHHDEAEPGSEVVLLGTVAGNATTPSCLNYPVGSDCIAADGSSHTADDVVFGPDGALYVSIGDASSFNMADPNAHRALSLDSLNGKVLRINPDGTAPADNPFYNGNSNSNRSKVWSYGFRNPFRMGFNPLTGSLFVGDVGWYQFEEIDVTDGGDNFGWPCHEGFGLTPGYGCSSTGVTNPIHAYAHDPETGAGSVTGGIFYAGESYPAAYHNSYFFGDFSLDFIKRIVIDESNAVVSVEEFATDTGGPVAFFANPHGDIEYISIYSGEIRRISYTAGNHAPVARVNATPLGGLAPLTVSVSAASSTDVDDNTLSYHWDFGDGSTSTLMATSHAYATNGTYTITLTVSDGALTGQTTQQVIVGNMPPVASVDSPVPDAVYTGGQYIPLIGSAQDLEDGALTGASLSWRVILHHNVHIHVLDAFTGTEGYFLAPADHDGQNVGDAVFIEIEMTATDSVGLKDTKHIYLYPAPLTEAAPYPVSASVSPATLVVGQPLVVTAVVANAGTPDPMIVDIEVFNAAGSKVAQAFYENQTFGSSTTQYLLNWIPTQPGTYRTAIGFIRPGWSGLYGWHNDVTTFTVLSEAPTTTPALLGGGLVFDGVNDYVETENWDIEEQAGFTLEAIVIPQDLSTDQYLLSKPDSTGSPLWIFGIKRVGGVPQFAFGLKTNGVYTEITGGTPALGERIHMTAAFDATNMILYKNGVEVARAPKTGPLTVNRAGDIWIGGISPVPGTNAFNGIIDEMRVWNLPRTPEQIAEHIDQELVLADTNYGLIKYWKFNEGFGQDTIDSSNSGHHGVLGSTVNVDGNDPARLGMGMAGEGGAFAPTHQSLTYATSSAVVGLPLTLTETVTNGGDGAGYAIVDVEVFDAAGNQVHQKYFDGEGFTAGQSRSFDILWMPAATGTYRVSVGVMKLHWLAAYEWVNSAALVTVMATSSATTTTPVTPTGPFTPTHVSTIITPATTTLNAAVTVTTKIKNTGSAGTMLVDLEVYDGGTKVGQSFFDSVTFAAGEEKTFAMNFTPTHTGSYGVAVGLLQEHWAGLYQWFGHTAEIVATTATSTPSPAPPATTTPALTVYGDTLAGGWGNWSWDTLAAVNAATSTQGASSLSVTHQSAWGGLFLHHAPFDVSAYTSLKFNIFSGPTGNQKLQVIARDGADVVAGRASINSYIPGGTMAPNTWYNVEVPLSVLNINTLTSGVMFQGRSGAIEPMYSLDNIRFE